jgi:ABC-type multidrug transport system ATPase subunit
MVGLSAARRKPMRRFSGGMRQRAGIAQFLLRPNPIIIVDEPTAGLDPAERVRFRLLLSELARSRIVILSTHIVDDITSSCNQVAVLNQGRLLYHGDLKGIERQAQGRVWDVVLPAAAPAPVPPRQILFRKHVAEGVLYHYISGAPAPGSAPVQPTFEDAYIALLSSENTTEAE